MQTQRVMPSLKMENFTAPQRDYLTWLRKTHPAVYAAAIKRVGIAPAGLAAMDWGGMFSSIVQGVKDVAPGLIQARQQLKLLDIQAKRAKLGQAPMSAEEYAAYATPATGASYETGTAINVMPRIGGMTVEKLLIYGGVALGLSAVLFFVLRKRR